MDTHVPDLGQERLLSTSQETLQGQQHHSLSLDEPFQVELPLQLLVRLLYNPGVLALALEQSLNE